MSYGYLVLALVGGVLIPLQVGINSDLARRIDGSLIAALISFSVGAASLFIYSLASRVSWPSGSTVSQLPWWMWTGGMLGAYIVWVSIVVGPRIGGLALLALIISGQLGASIVFDHFGWLGFPVREISLGRVGGVVLLAAGVYLVQKF